MSREDEKSDQIILALSLGTLFPATFELPDCDTSYTPRGSSQCRSKANTKQRIAIERECHCQRPYSCKMPMRLLLIQEPHSRFSRGQCDLFIDSIVLSARAAKITSVPACPSYLNNTSRQSNDELPTLAEVFIGKLNWDNVDSLLPPVRSAPKLWNIHS